MKYYYHLNNPYFQNPLDFDGICIAQIGRMFCKSGSVIDSHVHTDLFELTVVTDGKGEVFTNSVPTAVEKGSIYLSFPGDEHRIESSMDAPLKYDFLAFRPENETFQTPFFHLKETHKKETDRVFFEACIQDLMSRALGELHGNLLFSNEILTAIFKEILSYTIRGMDRKAPQKTHADRNHKEILCYSLMHYIDTHLYSMKSLKELEKEVGYSYGYLSSLFRKTTSQSLVQYHRKKKLSAAATLLEGGKHSVTQISELLNYSSPFAFSKAFKEEFGISPKSYLKK